MGCTNSKAADDRMPAVIGDSFVKKLEARRAIKSFESVPADQVDIQPVLEAIRLAPTSCGLQPFTIQVVSNPELKQQLSPASFGQPQVTECSHLLVFVATSEASAMCERYIKAAQLESAPEYAGMIRQFVANKSAEEMFAWSHAQSYIALGFALAACADLGLASCPMEGFNPVEVSKVLGLSDTQRPVAYLAIGIANKDEKKANPYPRFRFPESELVVRSSNVAKNETNQV